MRRRCSFPPQPRRPPPLVPVPAASGTVFGFVLRSVRRHSVPVVACACLAHLLAPAFAFITQCPPGRAAWRSVEPMAGGTWKIAVLVAVMTMLTLLELRTVDAQGVSACGGQCAANAYCYTPYYGGSYCTCRRGYVRSGSSGCRRRRLSAWRVVVAVIGALLGALLLLALCLACLRHLLSRRRRARGPAVQQPGEPAYGQPQQAFPPQGVPLYETNTHKVPGPAGVV